MASISDVYKVMCVGGCISTAHNSTLQEQNLTINK